jgi:hypothetical protein
MSLGMDYLKCVTLGKEMPRYFNRAFETILCHNKIFLRFAYSFHGFPRY